MMNAGWGKMPAPTIVGDRYDLLFELASGGMGTVYVGRRLGAGGFQRLVAIKRMHPGIAMDPEAIAAFHDEARIASLVQHANVVAIHDVYQERGEHILVMDYIDGASLATLLATLRQSRKRLGRSVALRILVDALRGLHAAHELVGHDGRPLELVHRDATPHNILLGIDGSIRLTDFGIARAAMRTVHTEPGFAKGKYCYMAPEQAFAEPLDRRADVFSMGIVAWETLTGRRLFENRTIQQVARGIAVGDIPAPSEAGAETPHELDRVVLRALAPWRQDRFATAAAFADALYAFAETEGGLAPPRAVAEVLDLACGAPIRQRGERIRGALCAREDVARGSESAVPSRRSDASASGRTGSADRTVRDRGVIVTAKADDSIGPYRIETPTTVSIDVAVESARSAASSLSRRSALLVSAATGLIALAGGVAIGRLASDPSPGTPSLRPVILHAAERGHAALGTHFANVAARPRAECPSAPPSPPPRLRRR